MLAHATISPRLSVIGVLYKILKLTRSLIKLLEIQIECEHDSLRKKKKKAGDSFLRIVGL